MENVKTLAQRIKITNKELLEIMLEAGLSQRNAEDEVSPEDQKAVIAFFKTKREEKSTEKPKILSLKLPTGSTPAAKVNILHKRKGSTDTTKRSIEELNNLHEREQEQSQIAEEKKNKVIEDAKKEELSVQQNQDTSEDKSSNEIDTKTEPTENLTTTKEDITKKPDTTGDKKEVIKDKKPINTEVLDDTSQTKAKTTTKKRRTTPAVAKTKVEPTEIIELNEFTRGRKTSKGSLPNRGLLKSSLLTQGFQKPNSSKTKSITIDGNIQVGELAHKLGVKSAVLIKTLMKLGFMASINQVIDIETAILVAEELGHSISHATQDKSIEEQVSLDNQEYQLKPRSPIVTVMGHVDHGKTSLLDYIRQTKVVEGESGGITQHIGAYHVKTDKGNISFLDTPGHAAFTSMRARGATLTDIVVLVVASDDKIMPQTIEAIQHARSAKVPVVVALNKIDKPESDPEKLISELANYDLVPEDWGGDTQFVKISAITGEGVDSLLDAITLQSEVLELTAPDEGPAKGIVIESRLDKHKGSLASVLISQGQLKKGDQIIVGTCTGRVRSLTNELGKEISQAGPSIPVEITGLNDIPEAGDDLIVVVDEKAAKELIEARQTQKKKSQTLEPNLQSIEDVFANLGKDQKVLNIIIKADTRGSMEAIKQTLLDLETDDMKVNLVVSGTGGITETDISLAQATNSRVIGFHVRADSNARQLSEKANIKISYYSVIYELIDDIDSYLHGMLEPLFEEKILGTAEVRDVFSASRFGKIAGCMVVEGNIHRNKPIRVIRDNTVIYEGELESLRRFKEDVQQVRSGTECGIGVKGYKDVRPQDRIEVFDKIEVVRKRESKRS